MNTGGIGRVLVASLHQGIADIVPTRLEFYENWLHPTGLRDGRIGLAPLNAVLSFLRREGELYPIITARAGEYAAEWTFSDLHPMYRNLVWALPMGLRVRATLRVARRLIRRTYGGSRGIVRLRRGAGHVDVRGSIFCAVREPLDHPLCGFYAAAIVRLLLLFGLEGNARVSQCRGAGDRSCLIEVTVGGARPQREEAVAA